MMTMHPISAARIAAYLHVSVTRDAERIGPFTAHFDPDSDNRYRNYATPEVGAEPTADDIQALVDAFRRRSRIPRLEYVSDLAPAVWPALTSAGFAPEGLLPLMTCNRNNLRPFVPVEGIDIVPAITDEELQAAASAQNEAYGEPKTSPDDIARLRRTIESGGAVGMARDVAKGMVVGAGIYTRPLEGVTEIAAIGVSLPFRRRGIAVGLTHFLTTHAFAQGAEMPFLMAAREDEARLYAKVGFENCGAILHIAR